MADGDWERTFGQLYGRGLRGKDRLNEYWYANSPMKIIDVKPVEELRKVRYWIDCGDDDHLEQGQLP